MTFIQRLLKELDLNGTDSIDYTQFKNLLTN